MNCAFKQRRLTDVHGVIDPIDLALRETHDHLAEFRADHEEADAEVLLTMIVQCVLDDGKKGFHGI